MKPFIQLASKSETAVLVGLATAGQSFERSQEYLEELRLLCDTLQIKTAQKVIQTLKTPNPKTWIGSGKLQEIKVFMEANSVDKVIFDDELTPAQIRNIGKIITGTILDRSAIILAIFAMRAKTKEAKIQVEMAQYQYLLPRLKRMWTHLSRQQGGVTGMRGPGEKELETDRRVIKNKIILLRKKLEVIDKQRATQCKQRSSMVRIALVGYTNAGKSTLMQCLTKSETYVEDKLFATINSTVRRLWIQDMPCLLTDTVGFIRKLPHDLIVSFKATLDEIREADILLHVVDVSHPAYQEHIQVVQQTLQEIGANHIPVIMVFNKIDRLPASQELIEGTTTSPSLVELQEEYSQSLYSSVVFISAKDQLHVDQLKRIVHQQICLTPLLVNNPTK